VARHKAKDKEDEVDSVVARTGAGNRGTGDLFIKVVGR